LVRMTHRIDAGDAPARLLSLINRGRKARGAKAVAADNVLQREAQKAARDFFARPKTTQQEVVEDAAARLRRFAIAFRRVGGVMAVVTRLSDAAQLEPTFDPELSAVGIGVAQGSRPDTAANAIAVVILLAWPR
ncbi:MAG: CAP domain-containing protein, partial [Polyangiales bacterium]